MGITGLGRGWLITRPGWGKGEPPVVATWYIGPEKADVIACATRYADDPAAEWRRMRKLGYRCVKAKLAAVLIK